MAQCIQCQTVFDITERDHAFYSRIDVPVPHLCPPCRSQRRMTWRNERTLYPRTCDLCGANIIAMYHPDAPFLVYCQKCWWSDAWDQHHYAHDIDFSRPFFDQFAELFCRTPKIALLGMDNENSTFTNMSYKNKNCYLIFASGENQNVLYAKEAWQNRDSLDLLGVRSSERTYQAIDCQKLYNCRYCIQSDNCTDSQFLYDCRGCSDCFGCIHLRNKQYHIFNQPVPENEYHKRVAAILFERGNELSTQFFAGTLWSEISEMRRFARLVNSEQCTGDAITNSYNCKNAFFVDGLDTCTHVSFGYDHVKDTYDAEHFDTRGELIYDSISIAGTRLLFCAFTWFSDYCTYCHLCLNSSNLFGCSSLKKAQFCILNKPYSQGEYAALQKKIIARMKETGEWGGFFSPSLSSFGYNESVAQEYDSCSREEILMRGWKWQDHLHTTSGKETKDIASVRFDGNSIDDSIVLEIFSCTECGRNFKFIKQELRMYMELGLPIPKKCFDCRHRARFALRNPRKLWERQCMCTLKTHPHHLKAICAVRFETGYAPERPEHIFCEECYRQEVA